MTPPSENVRSPWISFLAHLFVILVAWTLFIKYLFPIGFALATNEGWATFIYGDLWPVAHLWLTRSGPSGARTVL